MCLIVFHFEPKQRLILAANRDEYFARPAAPLQPWPDGSGLIAGQDLKEGGAWLGVNLQGDFAALTNVRVQGATPANPPSRGELVRRFLQSSAPIYARLETLEQQAAQYAPFNLLVGNLDALYYLSNYPKVRLEKIGAGTHSLSNASLDTPWPKTQLACAQLQTWLAQPSDSLSLSALLNSTELADATLLPHPGVPLALERMLSAQFIRSPSYGTRASTGLILNKESMDICERSFNAQGETQEIMRQKIHF